MIPSLGPWCQPHRVSGMGQSVGEWLAWWPSWPELPLVESSK